MKEYRVYVWAWTCPQASMSVCVNARDEFEARDQAIRLATKLTRKKSGDFLALAGITYGE